MCPYLRRIKTLQDCSCTNFRLASSSVMGEPAKWEQQRLCIAHGCLPPWQRSSGCHVSPWNHDNLSEEMNSILTSNQRCRASLHHTSPLCHYAEVVFYGWEDSSMALNSGHCCLHGQLSLLVTSEPLLSNGRSPPTLALHWQLIPSFSCILTKV